MASHIFVVNLIERYRISKKCQRINRQPDEQPNYTVDVLLVSTCACFNTSTSSVVLEKSTSSEKRVLRALAMCCRDSIGALCDLYQMTRSDLIASPEYIVKQIIWDCFQSAVSA